MPYCRNRKYPPILDRPNGAVCVSDSCRSLVLASSVAGSPQQSDCSHHTTTRHVTLCTLRALLESCSRRLPAGSLAALLGLGQGWRTKAR